MKHTPQNNAHVLGLHAPTVRVAGTRRQKADQLMSMFDKVEAKIQMEEYYRGDRETLRIKS